MLCSVYTTIAGEYCDPGFCTPIGDCLIFSRDQNGQGRPKYAKTCALLYVLNTYDLFLWFSCTHI